VANDPAARAWFPGERIVVDMDTGLGPLAGIATALSTADGVPVIVLAWDMPFVPAALLSELRSVGSASPGASAVVPTHGAIIEPLCAWYAASALPHCRILLEAGERRAGALASRLPRTVWLEEEACGAFGDVGRLFTSVDTPERLRLLGGALP
jgi:molybdopterin-guanine dinucleotide biosynthesis protein A